jgi:hypothetical protein
MITENPACTDGNGVALPSIPTYGDGTLLMEFADDNHADTLSTFVKGNRWCERVDWRFAPAGSGGPGGVQTCQYEFYVPNDVNAFDHTGGGADATFVVGFYGPDGQLVQHSDPIPEAALAGFTTLTIGGQKNLSADFTGVNLGDNNGQDPGSAQVGWGAASPSSLRRVCP